MGARPRFNGFTIMASPWRRRRICVLMAGRPMAAGLREVSGAGAFLETSARPDPGANVEIHHPEAGAIAGIVESVARDGICVRFDRSEKSVAFALAAITADMSNPI